MRIFGKLSKLLHFLVFSGVFGVFPDTGILSRYFTLLFFSLSSLDASFTNLNSIFNAEILSILHLMLVLQDQFRVLSPCLFVFSGKRKTRVYPPGRGFFSASSSFSQDATLVSWRRNFLWCVSFGFEKKGNIIIIISIPLYKPHSFLSLHYFFFSFFVS